MFRIYQILPYVPYINPLRTIYIMILPSRPKTCGLCRFQYTFKLFKPCTMQQMDKIQLLYSRKTLLRMVSYQSILLLTIHGNTWILFSFISLGTSSSDTFEGRSLRRQYCASNTSVLLISSDKKHTIHKTVQRQYFGCAQLHNPRN